MAKLAFCDYHNMVAILEKTEHNTDFHQIVDFLEASYIRYALTISPTVYVSHIRQFWSTARIEKTNQETKILATVDGKPQTISESSLRRHLKLNDEEGISSLPDTELFENLSLMGYNILPNQRFTFQKGQFSHKWKFLIHTIMQCLNPKSTGFNEFSSNIATAVVCLATNRGEGFSNPTKPHHIPSPQEHHSPQHDSPPLSNQTIISEPIPQAFTETLTPRRYTRRAIRIAQSKALSPATDEHASLSRDDRQGEAFPTVSSLDVGLQRKQSQMAAKIKDQDLEISGLKARVKSLEDKERRQKSTELGSNDTEEMVNVLSSMEAANILSSRGATASISPTNVLPAAGVPTDSGRFPTVSAIFTTTSVLARDYEIERLHAEEELKIMIEGLDRSNEVIVKHLSDYEQAKADLSVGEKIELIRELVKYQDHRAKILKYQAKQSKPLSKKEQREFYISVLRSHARWKNKHFRGMTLEMKISEGVSEEELKGMMQLVPLEEVYIEALQVRFRITFGVTLYKKVSLIAALNLFKVTTTLQAKVVDPNLGNNNCRGPDTDVGCCKVEVVGWGSGGMAEPSPSGAWCCTNIVSNSGVTFPEKWTLLFAIFERNFLVWHGVS
uniref:Synaptobrevin, longin-like domain protein n=1 Tax=Tanacetum cinerariifolium TaxID=118510 RepID=A0A699J271_TANCI|nr:hypothetical protein [Tanacetum cinerariifolium]